MPLVSETPESAAEPWRNNLRGELHTELTGLRSEEWWTGRKPQDCPGRQPDSTLTSLPLPHLASCTRQQTLELLRTIHSFDPCIGCAVHLMDAEGKDLLQIDLAA